MQSRICNVVESPGLTQKTLHDFHVALTSYIFITPFYYFSYEGIKASGCGILNDQHFLYYSLREQECFTSDYHYVPV